MAASSDTATAAAPPDSIESLHSVGPTRAKHLRELGLRCLSDLLEYFPRDYQHELAEGSIASLVTDQIQTVRGEIVACDYIPMRPRPRFEATIDDGSAKLALVWFHGAYLRRTLHPGQVVRVRGKVKFFRNVPQMANPKWELVTEETDRIDKATFRPIYPASGRIATDAIARVIRDNLDDALRAVEEWFDPDLLKRRDLMSRIDAYRLIHIPANMDVAAGARRRLV
jgi:RecG-like helicase